MELDPYLRILLAQPNTHPILVCSQSLVLGGCWFEVWFMFYQCDLLIMGHTIKLKSKIWCEIGQHLYMGTLCDLRGGMCKNCLIFCEKCKSIHLQWFFFKWIFKFNLKNMISSYTKKWFFFSNNFLTSRKKLLLECMITWMNCAITHPMNWGLNYYYYFSPLHFKGKCFPNLSHEM